jgi:hypothetical protein
VQGVRVFPERWRNGRRVEGRSGIIRAQEKQTVIKSRKVCSISGKYGKKRKPGACIVSFGMGGTASTRGKVGDP